MKNIFNTLNETGSEKSILTNAIKTLNRETFEEILIEVLVIIYLQVEGF